MNKLVQGTNDLASQFPDIAKEWGDKNLPALPNDVFKSEHSTKRWWTCSKCGYEWQSTVSSRTYGHHGCKECGKKKVSNDLRIQAIAKNGTLAEKYPDIANEWDYEKNELTPYDISPTSGKLYYWRCPLFNHSYTAYLHDRIQKNNNCPYCSGKRVLKGFNDLATTCPDIAMEWDYEKNFPITPEMVTWGSSRRVSWVCSTCGYKWDVSIANRTSKTGSNCNNCNGRIQTSFPEQAIFFYIKKTYPSALNRYRDIFENRMELDIFIPEIKLAIEYDGIYHNAKMVERDSRKYQICQENGIKLIRIKANDTIRYSNCCDIIISCPARPTNTDLNNVILELGKYCNIPNIVDVDSDAKEIKSNFKAVLKKNSLAKEYPELSKQWDYEKNFPLTPDMFLSGSGELIWWTCDKCNGKWTARINARTSQKQGCPYCSNNTVSSGYNDLQTRFPLIAQYFDTKNNNGITPSDIIPNTNTKYYWICSKCGKSFLRSPKNIVHNNSSTCSECSRKIGAQKTWISRKSNGPIKVANSQKVAQYTLEGIKVAEYNSITQAAKDIGASPRTLNDAVNGKQKTCKGYIWGKIK